MSQRVAQLAFLLLVLLALLSPLPLGSNREWSWSASAFLAGGVGLAWLVAAFLRPASVNPRLSDVLSRRAGWCWWLRWWSSF